MIISSVLEGKQPSTRNSGSVTTETASHKPYSWAYARYVNITVRVSTDVAGLVHPEYHLSKNTPGISSLEASPKF